MKRVNFLHVPCIGATDLGITDGPTYTQLFESVTDIIHSAWPVNFNLPLQALRGSEDEDASFEHHIAGVRKLIDFAAVAPRKPQLTFISSLSSVVNYKDAESGGMPETVVEDSVAPSEGDYGRSKWLAEVMLDMAAKSDVLTTRPRVVRIGQIAGPSPEIGSMQGRGTTWPKREMVPSMIRSSATIGALPESLFAMEKLRWIPVDEVARVVIDIAESQASGEVRRVSGALVFNVSNVQSGAMERRWGVDMIPVITSRLSKTRARPIEVVSMQEWIHRVEKQGTAESGCKGETHNPAMKLLSFFEDLIGTDPEGGLGSVIETDKTRQASHTFRSLQPIDPAWVEGWMAAWGL
jgi:thioester reductase-like protein